MPVTKRRTAEMRTMLLRKGFSLSNSHHEMFWLYADGRKTSVHTYISNGAREYDKELLSKVKRQIYLTDWQEFDEFMDCQMDGPAYLKLMKKRGHVIQAAVDVPASKEAKRKKKT